MSSSAKTVSVMAPAKVNLFLAINGVREDGFHNLVSLVVPLVFGDYVTLDVYDGANVIISDTKAVPLDENNLVMKAIKAFRKAYEFKGGVRVLLEKQVPVGAGLGGGSSDAVAALEALNLYFGYPLGKAKLVEIAAGIGSDCCLFLEDKPCVVRGRGELVSKLEVGVAAALSGQRVLLFKPEFGIDTEKAYGRMRTAGTYYMGQGAAEGKLHELFEAIVKERGRYGDYLYNYFESVIFKEHEELRELAGAIKGECGVRMLMSGSGSACFCLLDDQKESVKIKALIQKALGNNVFMIETFMK